MRDKLIRFINSYLSVDEYDDYITNGLQVEGKKEVKRILFTLSYSIDVAQYAVKNSFDMIISHHGIVPGKTITGVFKKRIEPLIKNDINLACYHLPLDAHPTIGNNITIAKLLLAKSIKPFGKHKNSYIGFKVKYTPSTTLDKITTIVKSKINQNPLIFDFGRKEIKTLAIISGAGSSYLQQAIDEGIDLFLTGEVKEEVFHLAKDSSINLIAAGHTHTEIFGIRNLQRLINSQFNIYTEFLPSDNPI